MAKFLIKIKQDTVKPNPDAGRTSFLVPGIVHTDEHGNQHRDVQRIHTMTPSPAFLFEYEDTKISCVTCGSVFSYRDLKADATGGGGDEAWSNTICPVCGAWDCCELEFEKLKEAKV